MRNHLLGKSCLFLFVAIAICFSLASSSSAAPAASIPREYELPSGETFTATQYGDEMFNWVATEDGDVILLGDDGYWHYAKTSSTGLKILDEKVAIDKKPRNTANEQKVKKQSAEWKSKRVKSLMGSQAKQSTEMMETHTSPEKLLVLLVEFPNISMRYPENSWTNVVFGDDPGTLNHYYKENSGGKFYFTPAEEQSGTTNDGIIRVRLPYNHLNTGGDLGTDNAKMVRDAVQAVDEFIDFGKYDSDKNGYISAKELHIMTILAGYEASYDKTMTPSVWGHKWSLSNPITLDQVSIGNNYYGGSYTQFGEVQANRTYQDDHMATIGVMAHELGHDLGLPDLYDGDGSSEGLGIHSLMAGGSWGALSGYIGSWPTHFDPWSKMMLGFTTPTIATSSGEYTVNSIGTNNYNIIKVPTSDPDQYFLVENRQLEGYDRGLQGNVKTGGVAVWHIDEEVLNKKWFYNSVNNDESHKGVDLEEANESIVGYSQLDKNMYYAIYEHYFNSKIPTFGPASKPNSNLYNNTKTNIVISSAQASASTMQVNVILPRTLKGLETSEKALTMQVGETRTIQAFATYSDDSKENVTSQATWSKSSSLIDLNKGIITAKKPGSVTVNVSYMDRKVPVTITIQADAVTLKELKASKQELSITKGQSQYVLIKAIYSDGKEKDVTRLVSWKMSDPLIATVTGGKITGKAEGAVTITANMDGKEVPISVVVKSQEKTVSKIAIDKTNATLKANETIQLKVTATFSDKTTENVTEQIEWTVKNGKIASVDKGVVTALAPGTTTITAMFGTKKAVFTLKVADPEKIVSVKADQTKVSLHAEESKQITVTATYEDGSTADVTQTIDWTTANAKIAIVEKGLIVAKVKGTTTITGKIGTKYVRVYVTVRS